MERSDFYADARSDLPGPLAGVTVVEATTTWAGPMAGCVLADLGADVIKVEHPDGEVGRRLPPALPNSNLTVPHETVNRNKRNVCINLQHAEGRDVFLQLCRSADVVVENFRPGTLAKWGVGYADVKAVKPDIVYVSVSGFGQFGTYSDRVGYDPVAQHYSGWSSLNGEPELGPTKAPTYFGDDLGGLHGALGALAALRHRDRTGEGQHVDVALVDAVMFQSNGYLTSGALNMPLERMGNQFSIAVPVDRYQCTDGYVFAGVLLDTHWQTLCNGLLDRPDLAEMTGAQRIGARDELNAVMADFCGTRSVVDVVNAFADAGLPATRVNSFAEAAQERHVHSRDMLQTVTLSDGSEAPLTGPAAKFSRTPTRIRDRAATLGEHTRDVLGSVGYSPEALEKLNESGAIGLPEANR